MNNGLQKISAKTELSYPYGGKDGLSMPLRFVLFNIHPVSARLRFLKDADQHICLPAPLPRLSAILPHPPEQKISVLPHQYLRACRAQYHLSEAEVGIVSGFRVWVETPALTLPVYALQYKNECCSPLTNSQWIELPDAFQVPALERELMHAIYNWLME